MKKNLAVLALIFSCIAIHAQDVSKISAASEIVWYGLDFSKAKLVGKVGSKPDIVKDKHMPSWNQLVAFEPQNFDLKSAVNKDIYYDLSPVQQSNSAIDVSKLESFNSIKTDFDKATLEEVIKKYAPGDKKTGVGLVFIVISLDKPEENSTVYATFFDIASHDIITFKRFAGRVDGVGFRNYWAGAWKHIIRKMDRDYSSWK